MPKDDWQANPINKLFGELYPQDVHSILDVGCGLSMKSQYVPAAVRVGVDIYYPYLEQARRQSDIGDTFVLLHCNILGINKLFLPKSFDVVVCFDVLEHLSTHDALSVLGMCEELARKAVCIETPRGFVPQNIDITGHGGHEWQTHRSGWHETDFTKRGYTVFMRDYEMANVQRHTAIAVDPHIQMLDAIKRMDR